MEAVDVWSGDILLPDGTSVKDVALSASVTPAAFSLPARPLRFLALVDVARIPLYLTVGPSLDAWTTNEESETWFSDNLSTADCLGGSDLSVDGRWSGGVSQSPIGILAEVTASESYTGAPRVTEILFYSTASVSSGPGDSPTENNEPLLRVHALPLCSDLLHISANSESLFSRPGTSHGESDPFIATSDGQFLDDSLQPSSTAIRDNSKRRIVDDLFDNAAERRKKIRSKGGEGVAAAAAGTSAFSAHPHHRRISSRDIVLQRPRTNSESMSVDVPRHLETAMAPDSRPGSRVGHPEMKSALSKSSKPDDKSTVENQNRDAISRIVMASMRMYGLQQRKKNKKSTRLSGVSADGNTTNAGQEKETEELANDDEYKMVYHNTFKSTVFAFRNHIASEPLHLQPNILRDTVDKLLAIFCSDSTMTSFPPAITPNKPSDAPPSADASLLTPSREGRKTARGHKDPPNHELRASKDAVVGAGS